MGPRAVAAAACALASLATPATGGAEIVRLTTGRLMTVEACRFDGDSVVFLMPGGAEIRAPRGLVAELLPDEVPRARPVALEALALSPPNAQAPAGPDTIRQLVDRVAARVGINRELAHAVVQAESNYQPRAVSPRGAMGLMQIMPAVARHYAVGDPFDPERNLEAGMRHLSGLLQRFDVRRALAAYNAGERAVIRHGGVPPYRETQAYVRRVLAALP